MDLQQPKSDEDYISDLLNPQNDNLTENELNLDYSLTFDSDLERIRERVEEMEKEIIYTNMVYQEPHLQFTNSLSDANCLEDKEEIDSRSVFVGNVAYEGTREDLMYHFSRCGHIKRLSIPLDKYSGTPKGFAYIEFDEATSVQEAFYLDKTVFHGRRIEVKQKRTNIPGISTTNRPPFGRHRAGRYSGRSTRYTYTSDQSLATYQPLATTLDTNFLPRRAMRRGGSGRSHRLCYIVMEQSS